MTKMTLGHFLYGAHVHFHRTMLGAKLSQTKGNGSYEGLHYMEAGNPDGPTILYIHGFGDNKDGFLWPAMLLKRYRLIFPDLPGFGDNPQNWQQCYDMDYSKGCLWQFIQEKDLHPCHVIGNSLGGAISIKLCLEHPERFKTLTLIDTAGFHYPHIPSLFHEYAEGINLFQVEDKETFQRLMEKLIYNSKRVPRPIQKYLFHRIKEQHRWFGKMMDDLIGKNLNINDSAVILERSFNEKVKDLKLPTLVMWGENDGLFPVEIAHNIVHNITEAKLHIFKKTGHAPQYEHPVKVASLIHRFIKNNTTDKVGP
ncbi:MAG: alpha/beta fold hydrolase [Bacteriovoracaceae bacterium]